MKNDQIYQTRPSDFYPDYFKTELGYDEQEVSGNDKSVSPLAVVVDEVYELFFNRRFFRSLSISSNRSYLDATMRTLARYGFKTRCLSEKGILKLYDSLEKIFSQIGTLESIEVLANCYFGDKCQVNKGWPYVGQLSDSWSLNSIRMVEKADDQTIIFVQVDKVLEQEKRKEFFKNCEKIIPLHYTVHINEPGEKKTKDCFRLEKQKIGRIRI